VKARILVVLCAAIVIGLAVPGTAAADPWKACKHGGWKNVYRTDGRPFRGLEQCRSYVRRTWTVTYIAPLVGANEVPDPGDPDATGSAKISLNFQDVTVCWEINVGNVDPITAAHIHAGPAGAAGPVVVTLSPYAAGCTSAGVDSQLLTTIMKHPTEYYVNVHNAVYPAGAARGQLAP
jgi:CHRD domain